MEKIVGELEKFAGVETLVGTIPQQSLQFAYLKAFSDINRWVDKSFIDEKFLQDYYHKIRTVKENNEML